MTTSSPVSNVEILMAVDGVLPPGEWPKPKETRPWVCRVEHTEDACTRLKPCYACRGARNRRSGMRKQREARKAIERATGTCEDRDVHGHWCAGSLLHDSQHWDGNGCNWLDDGTMLS